MRSVVIISALAIGLGAVACSHNEAEYPESAYCRDSAGKEVKRAAATTGEAVEGGVETAWAGVKQAGKATGGLVTGGTEKAERKWNEGKAETKQEAHEASAEVHEASLPPC